MKYEIPPLETLPLRHDFMFGQVMRNTEICRLFLEELLSAFRPQNGGTLYDI